MLAAAPKPSLDEQAAGAVVAPATAPAATLDAGNTVSDNDSTGNSGKDAEDSKGSGEVDFKPTGRFWAILFTLATIGLLSALENTVVTTALPQIVAELDLGENYVWVANIFFLTGAAVQPLFGQLANVYGRRWVTMAIVALFTLGSGICGGANSGTMLIAGRAVQGLGSGGIYVIVDVIVSDLVPLRVRGNYMAVVLIVYTVGMAIGPWVGGVIVERSTWRWVFYMTVPIGGASMIMIFLFLRLQYNRAETQLQKLARIDYLGNLILFGATIGILYALTYGGTTYPWQSARVLAPLIIGFFGFFLFGYWETKAKEPVIPPIVWKSRTAIIVYIATFLNSALLYWIMFFLPVYFQAVLGSSASQSGVQILPAILLGLPGAVVAVLLLAKFGNYKMLHLFGFAISLIGMGLFTLLDRNTSTAQWAIYQAVFAIGGGFVLNTLLPAVQAQLPESYQAVTTASWSFVRAFGSIWGFAIPAAVFNNRFGQLSERIADPAARELFQGGNKAYENAFAEFVWAFPEETRDQIIGVYSDSLKLLWQIAIAFAAINLIIIFFEKQVVLRTELETEFGLEEKKVKDVETGKAAGQVVVDEKSGVKV